MERMQGGTQAVHPPLFEHQISAPLCLRARKLIRPKSPLSTPCNHMQPNATFFDPRASPCLSGFSFSLYTFSFPPPRCPADSIPRSGPPSPCFVPHKALLGTLPGPP